MARSRIPLGFLTPLLLVAFAAGAWSVAWFYLSGEADKRIIAAIDEASGRGWTLDCEDRGIGGFPFRVEFRCAGAQLVIEDARGRTTIRSEALLGVALVYKLDSAIVEVTGPTRIDTFELGGLRRNYLVATDTARASFTSADGQIVAVSVEATRVTADIPSLGLLNSGEASRISADRAEFHVRQAENAALDVSITIDNSQLAGELAQSLFEATKLLAEKLDFLGQLTRTDAFRSASAAIDLAAWQGQGGELRIQRLKVDTRALDVEVSGVARIDAFGNAEGKFKGIFGKLDLLIDELKARGVLDDDSARFAAGAVGLLARPIKGTSRVQLPVNVSDGEVFLGPIKTMILPPLF
ncbi:hypothetical protein MNBD_ALPHA09-725 [hydrothermal vent metagenome]|uniref:DUF2125 domain-containing protein n=1 Tax=hydrothermal vent metagenome TaxID=652676 RepID=A0A3B0TYY6_9ZZZZ